MYRKFTLTDLKEIVESLRCLNATTTWPSVLTDPRYTQKNKMAFTWMVVYYLIQKCEEAHIRIDKSLFPSIALWQMEQKVYATSNVLDFNFEEISRLREGIDIQDMLYGITAKNILKRNCEDFLNLIKIGRGSFEEKLYSAATKITSLLELQEIKNFIRERHYEECGVKIKEALKEYLDIPGVKNILLSNNGIVRFFEDMSDLRRNNRWNSHDYAVKNSVLGHLFDVAIFSWIIAIENGFDEERATEMFFLGLFHDVPEVYTGDMPSPNKKYLVEYTGENGKKKTIPLRILTEELELKKMEECAYPSFTEDILTLKSIKNIMFEDEIHKDVKQLIKKADYMSADCECLEHLLIETGNPFFKEVLEGRKQKLQKEEIKLLKDFFDYIYEEYKKI